MKTCFLVLTLYICTYMYIYIYIYIYICKIDVNICNFDVYVSPLHGFQLLLQLKVLRNLLFYLYQQNKSSESKVKLRQSSNHYKRVLEAAKLAYANITKGSITSTPQKLGS